VLFILASSFPYTCLKSGKTPEDFRMTETPQYYVITANDLYDGEVVFWTGSDQWDYLLTNAYAFDDVSDAEGIMANLRADQVVGAYAIAVTRNDLGVLAPTHLREVIRAAGPTNYFHGKQHDRQSATSS
jgi:hypothetical protein